MPRQHGAQSEMTSHTTEEFDDILLRIPLTVVHNPRNKHNRVSGYSGLEVTCWPLVPKFAGSHPAEAVGFLGQKIPQHAFLWRGSKAIGPMS